MPLYCVTAWNRDSNGDIWLFNFLIKNGEFGSVIFGTTICPSPKKYCTREKIFSKEEVEGI